MLLSGGAGLGAESTLVSATHAGAEMKQIAVGPLTDAPASRAFADGLPRAGTALEGALTFSHERLHAHRNYLEMLVRAPSVGVDRPAIHAAVRGAH